MVKIYNFRDKTSPDMGLVHNLIGCGFILFLIGLGILLLTILIVGCASSDDGIIKVPYDIDPKTGKYTTLEEQHKVCVFPAKRFTDEDGVEWEEDESIKPTLGESLFGKGFSEKDYHYKRRGTFTGPNFGDN